MRTNNLDIITYLPRRVNTKKIEVPEDRLDQWSFTMARIFAQGELRRHDLEILDKTYTRK